MGAVGGTGFDAARLRRGGLGCPRGVSGRRSVSLPQAVSSRTDSTAMDRARGPLRHPRCSRVLPERRTGAGDWTVVATTYRRGPTSRCRHDPRTPVTWPSCRLETGIAPVDCRQGSGSEADRVRAVCCSRVSGPARPATRARPTGARRRRWGSSTPRPRRGCIRRPSRRATRAGGGAPCGRRRGRPRAR